jgi:hypothetical protein
MPPIPEKTVIHGLTTTPPHVPVGMCTLWPPPSSRVPWKSRPSSIQSLTHSNRDENFICAMPIRHARLL